MRLQWRYFFLLFHPIFPLPRLSPTHQHPHIHVLTHTPTPPFTHSPVLTNTPVLRQHILTLTHILTLDKHSLKHIHILTLTCAYEHNYYTPTIRLSPSLTKTHHTILFCKKSFSLDFTDSFCYCTYRRPIFDGRSTNRLPFLGFHSSRTYERLLVLLLSLMSEDHSLFPTFLHLRFNAFYLVTPLTFSEVQNKFEPL